jgi:hypothetical protein
VLNSSLFQRLSQTGGASGCSDHGWGNRTEGAKAIHRFGGPSDPPLLFDLDKDPAEAHALDPKDHAAIIQQIDALRKKTLENINGTLHHIADYTMCKGMGQALDSCSPCCNKENVGCRCTD